MNITTQRSVAKGVTATLLGFVTLQVDVVPVRRTNSNKDGSFNLVTPDLRPVKQKYITEDGGVFDQRDLVKARPVGDGWVEATAEEIVAAKVGSLAENQIEFTVHKATDLANATRPGEKQYRLRPASNSKKVIPEAAANLYVEIRTLIERRPDLVFVGALRLRNARSVYRLEVWDGQLLLSELIVDADLQERDVLDGEVDERKVKLIAELADSQVAEWDPSVHRWDVEEAVADLVAAKADDLDLPAPEPVVAGGDLMAMLEAAVAEANREKVPA